MYLLRNRGLSAGGFKPIEATGGTVSEITVSGVTYKVHHFTSTGESFLNVTSAGSDGLVEYFVQAGGGPGIANRGGGGGAGGMVTNLGSEGVKVSAGANSVIVGAGGARGAAEAKGIIGGDSSFLGVVALGGACAVSNTTDPDRNGGCGSGTLGFFASAAGGIGLQPSSASGGFGNNGGASSPAQTGDSRKAGGGGGTGAAGGTGTNSLAGSGGVGRSSVVVSGTTYVFSTQFGTTSGQLSGGARWFGGGGGGGTSGSGAGAGGIGGGGAGALAAAAGNGLANSGGGGGGNDLGSNSGVGGSGIVIIRYPITEPV